MITANRSIDGTTILSILNDPEVLDRISDDGASKATLSKDKVYILIKNGELPIGVFILDSLNAISVQVHCNFLKEHRENAFEGACKFYEWVINNLPKTLNKIVAEVPTKYDDVYHFCLKMGFKDEGLNRQSIMKGGFIFDQHRVGITRSEVVNFLEVL